MLLLNDDLTGSGVITWFYRVGGAGLRRRRVGSRQHHSRFLQTNGAALRRNHNRHPYLAFRLGHFGVALAEQNGRRGADQRRCSRTSRLEPIADVFRPSLISSEGMLMQDIVACKEGGSLF